jgi:hypothetical protein
MKKIMAGEYEYKGYQIQNIQCFSVHTYWTIFDKDNYAIESCNTKRDCKVYIDNMLEDIKNNPKRY